MKRHVRYNGAVRDKRTVDERKRELVIREQRKGMTN
jgi:hypothetical protein